MSRFVVDASVALKWFLPEPDGECAARLRREGTDLDAPDLLHAEVANALWEWVRRGELKASTAGRIVEVLSKLPIEVHPSRQLSGAALQIACATGLTVYDSLYLATALLTDGVLVTADRPLFETAGRQPALEGKVLWVGDVPA